jgi:tRNA pseudouridine32 synthase/23S rRNA pseudouridine746 synthase
VTAIPVLYENQDILVINKPSGIAVHDAENRKTLGIVSLLKEQGEYDELYLCHRLDAGTSGCLCLAKNAKAAAEIGRLFESTAISKYYLALSKAKPKKKQGSVIGDMKNRRGGQHMLLKTRHAPAITQFFSYSAKPGIRGFVVKPHTGKTHQIRVALKSIGAPILGDDLYAGESAERLHLHAWQLSIPFSTGTITTIAPLLEHGMFADIEVKAWINALPPPDSIKWPTLSQQKTKATAQPYG